jgi:hypothetical protein
MDRLHPAHQFSNGTVENGPIPTLNLAPSASAAHYATATPANGFE